MTWFHAQGDGRQRQIVFVWFFWGVLGTLASCMPAIAQTSAPASQPAVSAATTQPSAPAKPLPGPKYALLRYDDDFSYLDGPPGSYKPDFFDPIKRIHIGDDLVASLGADVRGRMESVTNKNYGKNQGGFGGATPTHDDYFLQRYYYGINLEYKKIARVYVEGISAWADGNNRYTPLSNYRDRFDVSQLFLDLKAFGPDTPLTVRFGRQEMSYGRQRVVGPADWANVRRTWDALKLIWDDKTWKIDAFYAKPVDIRNLHRDTYDEDVDLYGLYVTYKGIKNYGIDLYFFGLDNTSGNFTNANYRSGDIGDDCTYTLGTRFFGKTDVGPGTWDYDTEFGGQWGKASGDTIQAWMWAMETGYTFNKALMKPRIGLGFDYASGDDNPFDNIHQSWNQLFPTAHMFLGYLDQIGRQNIVAPNVNLTLKPLDNVTTCLAFYAFWLDHEKDALYNALGRPARRSVFGDVGKYLGDELDLTIQWDIDVHTSLLFGYSHMWASNQFFSRRNGDAEDPDLIYFQYRYQF